MRLFVKSNNRVQKKSTDATDIRFLLEWCAEEPMYPTASEVPNATKPFVEYFIAVELWANAGYDVKAGEKFVQLPPSYTDAPRQGLGVKREKQISSQPRTSEATFWGGGGGVVEGLLGGFFFFG